MKRIFLATITFVLFGFTTTSANEKESLISRSADGTERRCCIVEKGRWVREPQSLWSPAACTALGEVGEYAPQGTPGAQACAANEPLYDDPSPIPSPNPNPPRDDDSPDGDQPGGDGEVSSEAARLGCPETWGPARTWSPSEARAHAVAYVSACDKLIARALAAGDWATLETLRANLELWGLESVALSDPLANAMASGSIPSNIGDLAAQSLRDTDVLSGAQRAAAVLENFIEAAQIAAPHTVGAVSACTGEGLWRFEAGGSAWFIRAADAAYVGTWWRTNAAKDQGPPIRRAIDTWVSFTVPANPDACPTTGAADAVRMLER